MTRAENEAFGRWGERRAAWWLRLHGWRIIASRVKVRAGEVDLIARRWKTTAFIEVKARRKEADLDLALDEYRIRRVAAAVTNISHRYARDGDDIRIDAILITPGKWPRHLVNIWHG
jgi:putative endonuclease